MTHVLPLCSLALAMVCGIGVGQLAVLSQIKQKAKGIGGHHGHESGHGSSGTPDVVGGQTHTGTGHGQGTEGYNTGSGQGYSSAGSELTGTQGQGYGSGSTGHHGQTGYGSGKQRKHTRLVSSPRAYTCLPDYHPDATLRPRFSYKRAASMPGL